MDDQLLSMLSRSLHNLELDLPGLDDLLVPRQACSGENAGKPPARRASRVPLVVSVLDVKLETERELRRWVGALLRACPDEGPAPEPDAGGVEMAGWLFSRAAVIGDMPWGVMCAEEIIARARLVSDVVLPPEEKDPPSPLEVGGVREIVSWARHFGVQVSKSSVYRWVDSGVIDSDVAPDGRVLVSLADVLDACRDQRNHDVGQAG